MAGLEEMLDEQGDSAKELIHRAIRSAQRGDFGVAQVTAQAANAAALLTVATEINRLRVTLSRRLGQ